MKDMTAYKCDPCGYIYDPLRGEPKNGIPPGTAFEDLPDDYICPVCGAYGKAKIGKKEFVAMLSPSGRYRCIACGYLYDPENPKMVSLRAQPLKICRTIISALFVVSMQRLVKAPL